MADEPILIELDARGRASLGKLARHRRYVVTVGPDGRITLVPVRIMPVDEMAHIDRRAVVDEIADLPDSVPHPEAATQLLRVRRAQAEVERQVPDGMSTVDGQVTGRPLGWMRVDDGDDAP